MSNSKFLAYEFQVVIVPKSAPSLVGVASGCGEHPHTYMLRVAKVGKLLLLKLRHEDIYYSKETSPEMCHKKITTPNKVKLRQPYQLRSKYIPLMSGVWPVPKAFERHKGVSD